jgi:hypothetical protein
MTVIAAVRESAIGTKRTCRRRSAMRETLIFIVILSLIVAAMFALAFGVL